MSVHYGLYKERTIFKKKIYNGGTYDGYVKVGTGQCHGKGRLTFSNGEVYDGDWHEGKKHGQCYLQRSFGAPYKGQFENDQMHGNGTYKYGPDAQT